MSNLSQESNQTWYQGPKYAPCFQLAPNSQVHSNSLWHVHTAPEEAKRSLLGWRKSGQRQQAQCSPIPWAQVRVQAGCLKGLDIISDLALMTSQGQASSTIIEGQNQDVTTRMSKFPEVNRDMNIQVCFQNNCSWGSSMLSKEPGDFRP